MLMYLKPRIQGLAMTLESLARALGGRVLTAIFVIGCVVTAANLDDCLGEDPSEGEGEDAGFVDGEGEGEGEEDEGMCYEIAERVTSPTPTPQRYFPLERPRYRTTCFQFDIER